jgi:hypothetical protein
MRRVLRPGTCAIPLIVVGGLALGAFSLSACGGTDDTRMAPSSSSTFANAEATGAADLPALINAENAAIYGYGVIGAHLSGNSRDAAMASLSAHRRLRDAWILAAAADGQDIPPAAIAYDLPFEVRDRTTALALATEIETRLRAVYDAAGPIAAEALAKSTARLARLSPTQ